MSEPVVNDSKRSADILLEHPLPPPEKPFWSQMAEPKPRDRTCKSTSERPFTKSSKRPHPEDSVNKKNANEDELAQAITQIKRIKIHLSLNPKPRTNLGETSGKNPVDRLVRPVQELAKSVTKTNS